MRRGRPAPLNPHLCFFSVSVRSSLMEDLYRNRCSFLLLIFTLQLLAVSSLYHRFSPIDNYLIDCGSSNAVAIDGSHRKFTGDSVQSDSVFLFGTRDMSFRDSQPDPGLPPIYHTARVFTRPSKYEFEIRDRGTHVVRLHFHQLNSAQYDVSDALFHVSVNGFLVLSNFTGYDNENARIKEYLIWADAEKLVIRFIPSTRTKFAFVNAIEVISAPKDLIADTAQFLNGDSVENFYGLTKQALEVVYRVNVGGPKVTPFNDSFWRTWVPDEEFLKFSDGSRRVYTSGRIRYQKGGVSREVCPDNVYNSARVISSSNATVPDLNLTWGFDVVDGYKYLVRMHFCDIASIAIGLIYFNVYVDGYLAYKDMDLSYITNEVLSSPFYADFVVDGHSSGVLTVSVGPSSKSFPHAIDAILNGVEIMKFNNSMGSLDGEVSMELVLKNWPRGNICVVVALFASVCLLLASLMLMHRRRVGVKDSVAWSPLPMDISQGNMKSGNQISFGKIESS